MQSATGTLWSEFTLQQNPKTTSQLDSALAKTVLNLYLPWICLHDPRWSDDASL